MNIATFKQHLSALTERRFADFGYALVQGSSLNVEYPWSINVWYTKTNERMNYRIAFQPYVLSEHLGVLSNVPINEFVVNLYRNYWIDDNINPQHIYKEKLVFFSRVGAWLWYPLTYSDYLEKAEIWYRFRNETELVKACDDALGHLQDFGIPWLENSSSKPEHLQNW